MSLVPVINVREGWKGSRMVHEGDMLSILRNNIGSTTPFAFGTLCLHICDSCQLRCGYCNYKDSKRPVFLDEKPVALLRQLEFLNVVIVGGGEPTFGASRGERFAHVLGSLRAPRIGLITNGVEIPLLAPSTRKLDWVRVSLDACTRQTYVALKKVDRFDTVVQNLRKYHTMDLTFLGVGFTVTKDNVRDIPLLPALLHSNNLRDGEIFIQFKFLRGYPELLPSAADLIEAATTLVANAERLGLSNFLATRTNLANLSTFFSDRTYLQPTTSKCYYSLLYLLVKANGDVYPCGSMAFRSLNRLGNANDGDIDSITNNARRFHELNTPESNPTCVGCWDDHINVALQKFLGGEPPPRVRDELLFPYPFSRFWG
jgi:radical SAM protein with 4Fe4S-binding SPASM domain